MNKTISGRNNRKAYLMKNTAIFALSNFSSKIVMFFLVPLYTWKLSTSEYGVADLLFTVCSFLYPLFTLNIVEAVFRFSMDKKNDERKIIANGVICNIICMVLGLSVIPILKCMQNYSDYALIFYLFLITVAISQTSLAFLKGQEKLKLFSIGNIVNVVCLAIASFLFLFVFNMSIYGYFLAYIVANISTVVFCFIGGKIKITLSKGSFDKKLLKIMLKYSVVLIPTSFMWWIINSSDRVMIASFIGDSSNGIYAVSYKLPSLLTMLATIFNQAWVFSAINEKDSDDYEEYTNGIFTNMLLLLSLSSIIILGLLKTIFSFYVAPDYYAAWKYVPFLVFGFVFMTLATFISTSYNVHKDSKGFLFSGLSGAIANIILNFIFIPIFGIYGAALATMLSYVIVFIYRIIDTWKYVRIKINIKHIFLLSFILLSCASVYFDTIINLLTCVFSAIVVAIVFKKNLIELARSLVFRKK